MPALATSRMRDAGNASIVGRMMVAPSRSSGRPGEVQRPQGEPDYPRAATY